MISGRTSLILFFNFSLLFRKDFYIEVPELSKMSDAEVEEYRTEMEGIKVGVLFKHILFYSNKDLILLIVMIFLFRLRVKMFLNL